MNSNDEKPSLNRGDKKSSSEALSRRFQRGIKYLRQNRADLAKSEFKEALMVDPDDAPARFGLGCVYAFQGLRDQAVEEWTRSIEFEPDFAEAHYALAWAHYDAGNAEKGYEHVRLARETGVPLDHIRDLIDRFVRTGKPIHVEEETELIPPIDSIEDIEELDSKIVEEEEGEYEKEDFEDFYTLPRYGFLVMSERLRDILYIALIIGFGLFLCRGYFYHEYLATGYPDWIYHAYRIKSLVSYGFLTWSNDWVGGFPIWQSYQFIPHMISAGIVILTGWSIPKTMMVLTGFLFILLRLLVYVTTRAVEFSPEGGLLSSLLSFTIIGYFGPLSDFSLLWGATLFPVMVLGAYMLKSGRGSIYVYVLLIGTSFYIHPILSVVSGIVLCIRCLINLGWPYREFILSVAICALVSSFYWFPLVFGDKPAYTDPWVLSTAWQRMNMPRPLLGLSISLIGTCIAVAYSLMRREIDYWTGFLAFITVTLVIVVLLSYIGIVPRLVNLAMPTRWMVYVGILIALLAAPLIDWGKRFRPILFLIPVLLLAVAYDGYSTAQTAMPKGVDELYSPEAEWVLSHPSEIDYADRILNENIPGLSYFAFGEVRTTLHYFIQGSYDILSSPLKWLAFSREPVAPLGRGNFTLIELYLKATGTTHVMVLESHPLSHALLPGGKFEGELALLDHENGLAVFKVPWEPVQAFHTKMKNWEDLRFPNIAYNEYDDHILRDNLVSGFDKIMYGPDSTIVPVEYPSQTEIIVDLKNVDSGRYLLIFAIYDGSWQATVNDEPVSIERNGPCYIGIDISKFSGDLTVHLIHRMHWTWKMGGALTLLGCITGLGAFFYASRERKWDVMRSV